MSVGRFLQQAAAGNAGEAVYVDDVFSTYLYSGNNTERDIQNGLDLSGEGGLVWIKDRASGQHVLSDTENGANKYLSSSSSAALTNSVYNEALKAFNSDGFKLPGTVAGNDPNRINGTGYEYVSWSFRKQPGFFDVQTYTGNGGTQTVNHDLGCKPGLVIVKRTDSTSDWGAYMRDGSSDSEVGIGYLNLTGGFATSGISFSATSTFVRIFSSSFSFDATVSGATYVVYFFAMGGTDTDAAIFGDNEDESIIKCGTMTGSPNNFVDLGWEPQFLIVKRTNAPETWHVIDTMRGISGGSNVNTEYLFAESNASELSSSNAIRVSSTGFYSFNGGGNPYFYIAIRRPHKPASEFTADKLFETVAGSGNPAPNFISGFPVDMYFNRKPAAADNWDWSSRLTQGRILQSNLTNAESTNSDFSFDYQNGVMSGGYGSTLQSWMFRRAPGFFDVVAYTGTGSATTFNHNLGVVPQFMIVKKRSATGQWVCYHEGIGNGYGVRLDANTAPLQSISYWNDTTPTETVFSLGTNGNVNGSGATFVAYLFATVGGISKVGTYTGTGSDVDVDCGFTSGARFVLIRRFKDVSISGGTGDWYLWDSERGIVAGADPYLLLNSTAAQDTSTDYIDPLSSGFTVTSSAPAALNASADEYIFLAIA